MDTERMEAVAALISAETERRLVREIISELTDAERKALREKVLAQMLQRIVTDSTNTATYNMQREIERDLQDHARRTFNEKHLESAKSAIEASVLRYLAPAHIDKIVDSVAPSALSAAVKKIVERVALQFSAAR